MIVVVSVVGPLEKVFLRIPPVAVVFDFSSAEDAAMEDLCSWP